MEVSANTADRLYHELWWKMKVCGIQQESRNGGVISIPEPVVITLTEPLNRVLYSPVRDCNPFFHIAEVVWMFAGEDDVEFIEMFNKRYREYADDDGHVWGAYGARWIRTFDLDQIQIVIDRLKADCNDRQCVIGMWNPLWDLLPEPHRDRPCNTQVMFRIINERLDMLVTNRSNDLVWGAMGANVVHFTYLHELIATSVGVKLGRYRVVTNNLHVYPDMPRYAEIRDDALNGAHGQELASTFPILQVFEQWRDLQADCEDILFHALKGIWPEEVRLRTRWATHVAAPMLGAYLAGPNPGRSARILKVRDASWQVAAQQWWQRRTKGGILA